MPIPSYAPLDEALLGAGSAARRLSISTARCSTPTCVWSSTTGSSARASVSTREAASAASRRSFVSTNAVICCRNSSSVVPSRAASSCESARVCAPTIARSSAVSAAL